MNEKKLTHWHQEFQTERQVGTLRQFCIRSLSIRPGIARTSPAPSGRCQRQRLPDLDSLRLADNYCRCYCHYGWPEPEQTPSCVLICSPRYCLIPSFLPISPPPAFCSHPSYILVPSPFNTFLPCTSSTHVLHMYRLILPL